MIGTLWIRYYHYFKAGAACFAGLYVEKVKEDGKETRLEKESYHSQCAFRIAPFGHCAICGILCPGEIWAGGVDAACFRAERYV